MQVLSQEINAMVGGLQDRVRLRQSLAVAMEVQQNLLPRQTPEIAGLDIAGHSTYCDETGGDYYDYLDITGLNEHAVAVVIGDVMGHGVAAAMMMANARGILRSHAQQADTLGGLLIHLNELLVPDTGGRRFMTMLLMIVDAERRALRWASAGHDPPFIYDPREDKFLELEGGGLPLGIAPGEQYSEEPAVNIRDGWLIVTATDGVWEARNAAGEMFGRDRMCDCVRRHASLDARSISDHILKDLGDFIGELSHDDDVTFVVIRVGEKSV
jgi:sigma-B regulation protein RsbU (phosphoserine phosphatase)